MRQPHRDDPNSTIIRSIQASSYDRDEKARLVLNRNPELLCMTAARGRSEEVQFLCSVNPPEAAVRWVDSSGISALHHAA